MFSRGWRFIPLLALSLLPLATALSRAEPTPATSETPTSALEVKWQGRAISPLNGPWQFHLGDNSAWASPVWDDSGWEKLVADKTWGAQGHEGYSGFAWYRLRIQSEPINGTQPHLALFLPPIGDAYQVYWNGKIIGRDGSLPPRPRWNFEPNLQAVIMNRHQVIDIGEVQSGVIAIRVWKAPLLWQQSGYAGGFTEVPLLGLTQAVEHRLTEQSHQQYLWAVSFLLLLPFYLLAALLSLLAWLRDRTLTAHVWMFAFCVAIAALLLSHSGSWQLSAPLLVTVNQACFVVRDIALWYLLLWMLDLGQSQVLARITRIAAVALLVINFAYIFLLNFGWASNRVREFQIAEGILSTLIVLLEFWPLVLTAATLASRKRLNAARWTLALTAIFTQMLIVVRNLAQLGLRFTHWKLAARINRPLLIVHGSPVLSYLVTDVLVLGALVYAVYRYSKEIRERQAQMELEFQSARELQQVLIPEHLPAIPGFLLTSAYRPALEVGGDFFQIIPDESGSTLVVLGDVSGKGLKAAMAVSFIVGTIRTLAETVTSPAQMLAGINRRLYGRLRGGFATCVALRLDSDGRCTAASAGHPAPFFNEKELILVGSLPLGLDPMCTYEEATFVVSVGDCLSLYTDGLLEARSQTGELFGFERLNALFAAKANAEQAADAAMTFGQDDDITVLTVTRLECDAASAAQYTNSTPAQAPR